jgi:Icc-related predicted phosphoesterase
VPVEWLKDEWRKRGLLKRFQLSVSGCVGPCDVSNVVVVNSESGSQWLGNLDDVNQYRSGGMGGTLRGSWAFVGVAARIQRTPAAALVLRLIAEGIMSCK